MYVGLGIRKSYFSGTPSIVTNINFDFAEVNRNEVVTYSMTCWDIFCMTIVE